jgi:hypothetical protein
MEGLMDDRLEEVTGSEDGAFNVLIQCGPSKGAVTLSVPTKDTVNEVILCASQYFATNFRAISAYHQQLYGNDLFADYFELETIFVSHVLPDG